MKKILFLLIPILFLSACTEGSTSDSSSFSSEQLSNISEVDTNVPSSEQTTLEDSSSSSKEDISTEIEFSWITPPEA